MNVTVMEARRELREIAAYALRKHDDISFGNDDDPARGYRLIGERVAAFLGEEITAEQLEETGI